MHTTTGTLESTPSSPSISLADFDYDSDTPVDLPSTQEADSSVPLGLEPTIALDRGCLISSSHAVTQSDMASLRSMIQQEFDLLRRQLPASNYPVPATPPVTVPAEAFTDALRAELALQMAKVSVLEEETRNLRAEKQVLRTKLEQTEGAGGVRAELDAANAERQSLYVERQGLWDERAGLWRERQTLWDERADLWKERGHLWEERGELWVVRDRLTEQVQNLISAKSGEDQEPGNSFSSYFEEDKHHEKSSEGEVEGGDDEGYDRRLMRRVDFRLVPILCVLYAFSLIDRANLGSARVEGLGRTLGFEGFNNNRFSIILCVFFIGYFLFELPSVLVIRRVRPRNFLTIIVVLWGVVTLCMGFVHSWKMLVVCRAFLGVLEAGFFPGCVYLISSWYRRYEVQRRLTVFFMSSVLAAGISPIFIYGLARMNGLGGLEGWRWIFIMLGIITIVAGAIGWLLIVDFPDEAKFLTEAERKHVIRRLDRDRGDGEHDPLTTAKVLSHLTDWKIWALGVALGCSTMPGYALVYFTPIILRGFGFSVALSQILAAPPTVASVLLALCTSWWSDRIRLRTPFIIANSLAAIAGFTIILHASENGVRLLGLFLAMAGTQPQAPFLIGLLQNNIVGSSKRAVASGVQIAFGAIGGIIASTVYQEKDAPRYVNGLRATIAFHAGAIASVCMVAYAFHIQNKRLDRESKDRTEAELDAMGEKERALVLWRHTI